MNLQMLSNERRKTASFIADFEYICISENQDNQYLRIKKGPPERYPAVLFQSRVLLYVFFSFLLSYIAVRQYPQSYRLIFAAILQPLRIIENIVFIRFHYGISVIQLKIQMAHPILIL